MNALLNGENVRDRHHQQRIFPEINFLCDGAITKWIVGGRWSNNDELYPELQVWRSNGDGNTFGKVGNTTPSFSMESSTEIYEYTVDPPLEFQAGDILGVYQPHDPSTVVFLPTYVVGLREAHISLMFALPMGTYRCNIYSNSHHTCTMNELTYFLLFGHFC